MFGLIDLKGGEQAPFLTHFYEDGLFPNGIKAMLITMITVNFAFQGTELIGVAAGESEDPEKRFHGQSNRQYGERLSSLCFQSLSLPA